MFPGQHTVIRPEVCFKAGSEFRHREIPQLVKLIHSPDCIIVKGEPQQLEWETTCGIHVLEGGQLPSLDLLHD